jgi:hypothetical protein
VVFHHLDGFRRSRLPACCSRYRVWVRQVLVGSVVEAEAPRAGSVLPAGAPPCEGFLLVGSRATSLRPAPLLPFLCPTPSEDEARSSGSIHRCRLRRFRRTRQAPEAVFRPPLGDGCVAPVRRPSVREQVAPLSPATCAWTVSNRRSPGSGSPTVAHLAVSRLSARGPSADRLSPIVSWPPPRLLRLLEEAIDLELRAGHRCPALGPFRWWLSAPALNLQGSAPIASCPRPPSRGAQSTLRPAPGSLSTDESVSRFDVAADT